MKKYLHNSHFSSIFSFMKCSLKSRFYLYKTDLSACIRENRKGLIIKTFFLFLGFAVGIYVGYKIGEMESPYGVFASIFHFDYSPTSWLITDFLRFFLFALLCLLDFFLPPYALYSAISLFFFGKYYGQAVCLSFQSDGFPSACLSLFLVYLPLLLIGGALLMRFSLFSAEYRLCRGADTCPRSLKRAAICIGKVLLGYFIALLFIYLVLCGVIYLTVVAF